MLVFPLRPPGNDSQDGPPVSVRSSKVIGESRLRGAHAHTQYFVTPDLIKGLLSDDFDLEHLGDPLETSPDRAGKEKIMIWRRK